MSGIGIGALMGRRRTGGSTAPTDTPPVAAAAPAISPASGPVGTVFTVTTGSFTGTAPIAVNGVLRLDGVPVTVTGGSYTSTAAGALSWQVTATNAAGSVTQGASATVTVGEQGIAPLAGILDAPNVAIIGASLEAYAASNLSSIQAFAASAGFTGTLSSYAISGARLLVGSGGATDQGGDDQIAAARTALATTEGQNLYLYGIGGNDVSDNRPWPGGQASISAEYSNQISGLAATDKVAPIGITKRFYSAAPTVTADPATEANGSKPYNDNIYTPAIQTHAPDWAIGGTPAIDMYDFTARHPEVLQSDGVHYLGSTSATHLHAVLARIAGRALGMKPRSRAGRSLLYTNRSGALSDWTLSTANPANYLQRASGQVICWAGARFLDGTLDPYVSCIIPAQSVTFNSVAIAGATGRLADTHFHNAEVHRYSASTAVGVSNSWSWRGLWPGDVVTVTVMGCSGSAGAYGDVTIGSQTRTLQNAPEAASNQVTFTPITIGADGRLDLTFAVPASATAIGRLGSILLDFA